MDICCKEYLWTIKLILLELKKKKKNLDPPPRRDEGYTHIGYLYISHSSCRCVHVSCANYWQAKMMNTN